MNGSDRYFALVDCNNFYASCERVFQPQYNHRPVVVLSNNDGCVIARSNEAKALGISMGEPLFRVRPMIERHGVKVFSSNYTLYGDMSRRVMEILAQHCADVEVYSIDEAFLELRFAKQTPTRLAHWAAELRRTVLQWTGIPVSVGIARSKTLAKLANHIAKKRTDHQVYYLTADDPVLREISVAEVWGVGRGYLRRFRAWAVATVADLQGVPEPQMRGEFGVVGLRMLRELRGTVCYRLEPPVSARKHTMVSRSFAHDLYDLNEIQRRLALYATRLGEKLRQYDQTTRVLTVYLWINKYRNPTGGRTCWAQTVELPLATNSTNVLIHWTQRIARYLYRAGINYKKAGILAGELGPAGVRQQHLFVGSEWQERSAELNRAMDLLNRKMGRNTVHFAACGSQRRIPMRQDYKSPCYTTRMADVLRIV